ncbi:calcium-binding protein [Cognatishimia maritima]|uniref:Type I secretion C-terminal target domain (VC_A0849 subclass) n=1 Tax=Cognatishimia maritima TaxID=870908 RepID=A0A1M5TVU8_9RHOB|nr:calcium-binding protein [Cognatishimia maritima]SHH54834.1 hypothetical protein SAMN04488044_2713 [Cognatishimia maritima]
MGILVVIKHAEIGRLHRRMSGLSTVLSVALILCAMSARAEATKVYVFGNSLIHHESASEGTSVPHWLGYLSQRQNTPLELDGEWGFLRNFAEDRPPAPNWAFETLSSAWSRQYRTFQDVGYDAVIINPANFIQYQGPDRPYDGENPDRATPLLAAVKTLSKPGMPQRVIVYEGWAEMAPFGRSFPPKARELRKYHAFNTEDYHDWYVDFADALQAELPDQEIHLLPVARILSRGFLETGLSDIPVEALYSDDAPHGTDTLYFLAAIPVYAALFDRLPTAADVPEGLHPSVRTHFGDFLDIVRSEMPIKETAVRPSPDAPFQQGRPPALGYGLNGIADWSTQVPFVDHMKSARTWIGHLPGQFGGWDEADLNAAGALDPYGWPTRIPDALDRIETFMLTDFPPEASQHAGLYRLRYDGTGQVDLSGPLRVRRYGDGEVWFHFTPGDGGIGVSISETDPDQSGDYIRNISVVHEDQIPLYEAGLQFNPEWTRLIEPVRLVRFMDWMQTNGSAISDWQARPVVTDYSYTRRGVPLEVMVDLANQIGADPWFTLPHLANDAYVDAFARYVHAQLRPDLTAHVEYSNEVWNYLFPQAPWAGEQARARWGETVGDDGWMQFYGYRAAQVAAHWKAIFADQPDRLKTIITTHTDWPGLEGAIFEGAARAGQTDLHAPSDLFDAYAVTGYFGYELMNEDTAPALVQRLGDIGWPNATEADKTALMDQLADDLRRDSLKPLVTETWPYHAEVAARHNLDLIMYEGGTHVVAHGDWNTTAELTDFLIALNYSAQMAELYQELLIGWQKAGGTVFNAFVDVAKPSQWGSWGTRRHIGDETHRFDILSAYNLAGSHWDDLRAAEDFAAGVWHAGTEQAEVILGTQYPDLLLGEEGDDEFHPMHGKDHIHGGEGNDHVVLEGMLEHYRFHGKDGRLIAKSATSEVHLFAVETLSFSATPGLIISTSDLF